MILVVAVYSVAIALAFLLSTAGLVASLYIVEDNHADTFAEQGFWTVVGRCAIVTVVTTILSFIPCFGLISIVVWFLGIMFLFQKTFIQSLVLCVVNFAVSMVLAWGLGLALNAVLASFA